MISQWRRIFRRNFSTLQNFSHSISALEFKQRRSRLLNLLSKDSLSKQKFDS